MRVEIKVPQMGESISEAIIGTLLKKSGAAVRENDEIVEIETEKVNQPLYAPATGEIEWSVQEGESIAVGAVIGYVDTEKAGVEEKAPEPEESTPDKLEVKPVEGEIRQSTERYLTSLEEKSAPPPPPPKEEKRESRQEMSRIRKAIAGRLVDALHSAAMLTTFNEVDMSAVIALRSRYKESFVERYGVKLGFMSFFVKAAVEALKRYPAFNAYLEGEEIVQRHYYDIGIAVGTEKGLIVPVVRGCDALSFAAIEEQIAAYAQRARAGSLRIEDLEGGGFTITNGGIYGSLLSTPILNPPQVGILGMHAILNRPIAVKGEVVIRPMMYLALSYDHRIVDGKEAVSFLVEIKALLEDPARLLLDV